MSDTKTMYSELVAKKHSTRAFTSCALDKEMILEIVDEAARSTGTSRNAQEYQVYVLVGDEPARIRKRFLQADEAGDPSQAELSAHRKKTWSKKALTNREAFNESIKEFLGPDMNQYSDAQKMLFHAPALLILTIHDMDNGWSVFDLGAFTQSIQMSALARGIASVVAYTIVKYPDILRAELSIPDDERIIIGIALGYPTDDKVNDFRTPRMAVEEYTKVYGE